MSKQIHAHIQGLTRDRRVCGFRIWTPPTSSPHSPLIESINVGCAPSKVAFFSRLRPPPPRSTVDNQCDELTRICSKLLQENKQALSTNATEDDCLISIENVDDTTDKTQILRIPSLLREKQSNKNCFDPLVVSIGPYHHGEPQLEAFEKLKIPIAQIFVDACTDQVSIDKLYEEVAKIGKSARECYEKGSTEECGYENRRSKSTTSLELLPCFCAEGLVLARESNPLLVLEVLMKFLFKGKRHLETELIQNFLDQMTIMPPQENSSNNAVKKFLEQMGCSVQKKNKSKLDMHARRPPRHLLSLVREQLIGSPSENKNKKFDKWYSHRSVTELKSAGIHFRPSQTNHVTDVKFKSHLISGTLILPPIMVDDITKSLLLNLAAYERCPHGPSDYRIMSYICLMDSFIDHADDVKELRKRRIIVNNLGSDKELAQLFNEIATDLVFDPFEYADVKRQIQNHCDSKAQVWMAEWIHDHFSSPWAFLAFLGAILVIALTAVQTYFAVFPH